MSENQSVSKKRRIHVGGLFADVTEADLRERFCGFGQVENVEIKVRKDGSGEPIKTFAYMDFVSTENNLKRCFTTYNNTRWKGFELKLQAAKESFLTRLQKERKEIQKDSKSPDDKKANSSFHNPLENLSEAKDFEIRGAAPGTAIAGEKNWVVGKYGRVLPIVHIKRQDKRKVITVDPSKLCHNLKKIKTDDGDGKQSADVDSLTWAIEDKDSEMTKKRKGEFSPWKAKTNNKVSSKLAAKSEMTVPNRYDADHEGSDSDDLEIVKASVRGQKSYITASKQIEKSLKMQESDGDSVGSADTDEIIATSRTPQTTKKTVTSQNTNMLSKLNREDSDSSNEFDNRTNLKVSCRNSTNGPNSQSATSSSGEETETESSASIAGFCGKESTQKRKSTKTPIPEFRGTSELVDSSDEEIVERKSFDTSMKCSRDSGKKNIVCKSKISSKTKQKLRTPMNNENYGSKKLVQSVASEKSVPEELYSEKGNDIKLLAKSVKSQKEIQEKHIEDNKKRLQSLRDKKKREQSQKALVQQALACVDSQSRTNKKIVFDSDDEEIEAVKLKSASASVNTKSKSSSSSDSDDSGDDSDDEDGDTDIKIRGAASSDKKGPTLFDTSDEEGECIDESADKEMFRIRPQFEGKKGEKLRDLQSRYGNDERFRLDERFVESESDEESEKGEEIDMVDEEKQRSLKILEGVIGSDSVGRLHRQKKVFRDINALQFDPSREDHRQFEIKVSPEAKDRHEEKSEKKDKKITKEKDKMQDVPEIPDAGKEKFFEVTSSLKDAFGSKSEKKDKTFSLLAAFGQQEDSTAPDIEVPAPVPVPSFVKVKNDGKLPWQSPFKYDSSEEDADSEEENSVSKNEVEDMDAKTVVFPTKKLTFFFTENDERLQEGVKFFHRPENFESIREKWLERRPGLIESFKLKHKKALKRLRSQQKQKGRRQ